MPDKNDLFTIMQEPYEGLPTECIIADKVYDSCFQRECEPAVSLALPTGGPFTYLYTRFESGFIVDGTLTITPIAGRPNFARVRFVFRVPFTAVLRDDCACPATNIELNGSVDFSKDIAMYIPTSSDEFSFDIVIETRSQVLRAEMVNGSLILAIGVFVVIKVVGKVQLLVVATGFCPAPRECEEISPEDICADFMTQPLPPFFPPQFTGEPYEEA
ncbi:MAG: hypothetical protein PWP48_915 [Clostridiales bacterium]|jgi:hypothetical protein|nr:hypothetical protein [Clostridiales bacterium]